MNLNQISDLLSMVSDKRDISLMGNAELWNDFAKDYPDIYKAVIGFGVIPSKELFEATVTMVAAYVNGWLRGKGRMTQ